MGDGAAFGTLRPTLTVVDEAGREVRADSFGSPYEVTHPPSVYWSEELERSWDGYLLLVAGAVAQWHQTLTGAEGIIVNHATNDLLILLEAVQAGSGRTAARTARAMFEHLAHYREVKSSPGAATQYEEHRHVWADQISRARIGLHLLNGKERKKEADRLAAVGRRAKLPLQQALQRYGPSFMRGWMAGTSLYALAKRHGYEDDYESYRLLSGVMHGSAGAALGTRRERGGVVTHRLGMDLQLVPVAFHEGIRWWRALLDELPETSADPDSGMGLREATDVLLQGYPEIYRSCRRLDNKLWPAGAAPPRNLAVLALYPGDKVRWYVYDGLAQTVRPAELTGDAPDFINAVLGQMRPHVGVSGGRPATAVMPHIRVRPTPGKRPSPAAHLLVPHDVFGRPAVGRAIQLPDA